MKGLVYLGKKNPCIIKNPVIGEVTFRPGGAIVKVTDNVAKWLTDVNPKMFSVTNIEEPVTPVIETVEEAQENNIEATESVPDKKYLNQMTSAELIEKAMEYDLDFTVETPTRPEMIDAIKAKKRKFEELQTV